MLNCSLEYAIHSDYNPALEACCSELTGWDCISHGYCRLVGTICFGENAAIPPDLVAYIKPSDDPGVVSRVVLTLMMAFVFPFDKLISDASQYMIAQPHVYTTWASALWKALQVHPWYVYTDALQRVLDWTAKFSWWEIVAIYVALTLILRQSRRTYRLAMFLPLLVRSIIRWLETINPILYFACWTTTVVGLIMLPAAWITLVTILKLGLVGAVIGLIPLLARTGETTPSAFDYKRFDALKATAEPLLHLKKLIKHFRKTPVPDVKSRKTHGHTAEDTNRASARQFMLDFADKVKLQTYAVSRRSSKEGAYGFSGVHTPMDAAFPLKADPLPSGDFLFISCDVDYYLDLNNLLGFGRPALLYTFSPDIPAGSVENTRWWITGEQLRVEIAGCVPYTHGLWNFNTDELVIPALDGSGQYVYQIERRDFGLHRKLVLLVPVAYIAAFPDNFDVQPFPDKLLERIDLTSPVRWTRGEYECIAFENDRETYVTHVDVLNTLLFGSSSLRVSEVQAKLPKLEPEFGIADPAQVAPRVHRILGMTDPGPRTNVTCVQLSPVPCAPSTPLTRVLEGVEPLAAGAVHHTKGPNAELACLEARLTAVRNDALDLDPEISHLIDEFVDRAIGKPSLRPLDWEEVEALQNRPSQRQSLDRMRNVYKCKPLVVNSFIKAEAYPKPTAERNISNIPADHRCEYSRYTLPLAKHLAATTHWYGFSRPPPELAALVHNKVSTWDKAAENDYGKFDGTNGVVQATVVRRSLLAAYDETHGPKAAALALEEVDPPAFTKDGTPYSPGFSTLSGSPSTSVRNGLNNAFTAFVAHRMSGLDADAAYAKLGVYAGDDGLDPGDIAEVLPTAAARLGLNSKCKVVPKGEPITFLGRVYPNAWAGPESFSDPVRHLPKLHITHEKDPNVHDDDIALRKAQGFALTDNQTPLLCDWAGWITRVKIPRGTKPRGENWWYNASKSEGVFPQLTYDEMLPHVAARLSLTVEELLPMIKQLRRFGRFEKPLDLSQEPSTVGKAMLATSDHDVLIDKGNLAPPQRPSAEKRHERKKTVKQTDRIPPRPEAGRKPAPAKRPPPSTLARPQPSPELKKLLDGKRPVKEDAVLEKQDATRARASTRQERIKTNAKPSPQIPAKCAKKTPRTSSPKTSSRGPAPK
nr:MAG: RNA-dependent RNA polymerase [Chemarfal virus 42]